MTSIKIKFRPSAVAGKEGSICYQVIRNRQARCLTTKHKIFPSEWNEKCSQLIITDSTQRRLLLRSLREHIREETERLARIAKRFDAKGDDYTADDLIAEFERYSAEYSLFSYMQTVIDSLAARGKAQTACNYRAALSSFKRFRQDEDIMLDAIDARLIEDYEDYLRSQGIKPNTTSFYNRILRAVYNRAVEAEIIDQRHPFRRIYTGVDKTAKRALPLPTIKKLKQLDLSADRSLDFARDMFMLSFYLRGMSFVDMAYLRKTDLRNGVVVYRRRKTNQELSIRWTSEMQGILDKYSKNQTEYLLPIISSPKATARNQYRHKGYRINKALKDVAKAVGLSVPLTMYVARHSWASIAKSQGIPLSIISEGMGHDSEMTTMIYLASLDTSIVDNANDTIIKALLE